MWTEVGWGLGGLLPGLAAAACPARFCRRVGVLRAGSGRGPPAGPCANPSSPAIRHRVPKNEKDYKLEKNKAEKRSPLSVKACCVRCLCLSSAVMYTEGSPEPQNCRCRSSQIFPHALLGAGWVASHCCHLRIQMQLWAWASGGCEAYRVL